MPSACILTPDTRVKLLSERLEVCGPRGESGDSEELLREIPLRDLERLILGESTHITTPALAELLRRGIPVSLLSWNGDILGAFLPPLNAHGLSRLGQYRRTLDTPFALQISGRIVAAKIYNQRRVIQRLAASRSDSTKTEPNVAVPNTLQSPHQSTIDWLDSILASVRTCQTIDELRGYEGASTARYFQAWASFLPTNFPFERRSTRPPLNPVNACISFGATVLYHEMAAALHAQGLDPALGLLHATENGRWSLALDLMEPFRPVLVEALALDLFSHQILNASHFELRDGGVFLSGDGRKKFFLQYERRMDRQFMSEAVDHRTTLRQQLENQAIMFKAALETSEKFEPFLMN